MKLSKKDALEKLTRAIEEIDALTRYGNWDENTSFTLWREGTMTALEFIFGNKSPELAKFRSIQFTGSSLLDARMGRGQSTAYAKGLMTARAILLSFKQKIEEYGLNDDESSKSVEKKEDSKVSIGCEVFIVHGHDDGLKNEVARFVEKLNLKAIILHEQPNGGQTIIEKLESNSADVGFAIILLTPDDIGFERTKPDEQKLRARQNVILELGYFIGKIGRSKVCALCKSDLEIPNDYKGVLFEPYDSKGAWKFTLAREMKNAGLPVDLNLVG